jgi:dihydroneopterin aldolase
VAAYASAHSFDLIETLAKKLAELCVEHPLVDSAQVTVHKPDAPMPVGFSDVFVTVGA